MDVQKMLYGIFIILAYISCVQGTIDHSLDARTKESIRSAEANATTATKTCFNFVSQQPAGTLTQKVYICCQLFKRAEEYLRYAFIYFDLVVGDDYTFVAANIGFAGAQNSKCSAELLYGGITKLPEDLLTPVAKFNDAVGQAAFYIKSYL